MARDRLKSHHGKTVEAAVGPMVTRMRIDARGEMELVGESETASSSPPDVAFHIPLPLLARLARRDESAFSAVVFNGDSELASTLATVARGVDWDIEEDLSHILGDIAAHRVTSGARALRKWRDDAASRLTANLAEYLTEEKRAFLTTRELETLAVANEKLRDDVARLDARIARFAATSE